MAESLCEDDVMPLDDEVPYSYPDDGQPERWRPITTCPKDHSIFIAYAVEAVDRWPDHAPWLFCFANSAGVWDLEGYPIEPSHWMPLPAPPIGAPRYELAPEIELRRL